MKEGKIREVTMKDVPDEESGVFSTFPWACTIPYTPRDLVTFAIGGIFLMIAAQGGLGGGGIMVPFFILFNQMKIKQAIPIANAMVLGGGIANYFVFRKRSHPEKTHSPLVDWNIVIMLEPSTMIGAVIGVYLNKILPDLLVITLLVLTLSFTLSKMIIKAKNVYKKEKEEERNRFNLHINQQQQQQQGNSDEIILKTGKNSNSKRIYRTYTTFGTDENVHSPCRKKFKVDATSSKSDPEMMLMTNQDDLNQTTTKFQMEENTFLLHNTPPINPPNKPLCRCHSDVDIYYDPSSGLMPMEECGSSPSSFAIDDDKQKDLPNVQYINGVDQIEMIEEEKDFAYANRTTTKLPLQISNFKKSTTYCDGNNNSNFEFRKTTVNNDDNEKNVIFPPKVSITRTATTHSMLEYNKIIRHESQISTWKVTSLSICFLGICILNILQGGSSSSIVGICCGSTMYYLLMMCILLWVLGFFLYFRHHVIKESQWKATNRHYSFNKSEIRWDKMVNNAIIPILSLLAGLTAGLFGIGGGIVKGPLLMELGVVPQAAAAAAATMILFTAAAACITNLVLGTIDIGYGTAWLIWGFIMTYVGQMLPVWIDLCRSYRGRNNTTLQTKQYPVLFSVVAITALCILLMIFERVFNYIQTGIIDTQFHSICKTS